MSIEWKRREIELADVRLSALERTTSEGAARPPVLLLHGLVAEAETFRKLMAALPSDRRVIALDFPGAGYSGTNPEHSFGFHNMAEIVREVIARLGIDRPVLLGHSHGGAVALELAQSWPEELDALVLLCPAHPFSGRENALVSFYLSRVGRAFGHMLPHLPDWLFCQAFRRMPGSRRSFTREEVAPYLHTLRKPGTVDHLLALLKSWKADMEALRIALEAKPLEVPTLLVWGDRDVVVPVSSAEELKQHIRHCELLTLPGVGHLPNEEEPEKCAALIKTWLIWRDTHWKYGGGR